MQTPLSYDVKHFTQRIPDRGPRDAGAVRTAGRPPAESETVSVALHLINAEGRSENMHDTMANVQLIAQLSAMVEDYFQSRSTGTASTIPGWPCICGIWSSGLSADSPMPEDPATQNCPLGQDRVPPGLRLHPPHHEWLAANRGWHCTSEEQLYLVMHIHRVRVSAQGQDEED